jgi:prevent-host-death family protein
MFNVSVRALGKFATVVVKRVEDDNQAMLVTREGKPAAYLVPISAADKLGLAKEFGKKLTRGELSQW